MKHTDQVNTLTVDGCVAAIADLTGVAERIQATSDITDADKALLVSHGIVEATESTNSTLDSVLARIVRVLQLLYRQVEQFFTYMFGKHTRYKRQLSDLHVTIDDNFQQYMKLDLSRTAIVGVDFDEYRRLSSLLRHLTEDMRTAAVAFTPRHIEKFTDSIEDLGYHVEDLVITNKAHDPYKPKKEFMERMEWDAEGVKGGVRLCIDNILAIQGVEKEAKILKAKLDDAKWKTDRLVKKGDTDSNDYSVLLTEIRNTQIYVNFINQGIEILLKLNEHLVQQAFDMGIALTVKRKK